MAGTVFVTVVLLRFLVPLLIPRFPLPAIIACLVIDAADQTIFQAFTDDPLPGYQTYDKALDVYYLAIAYVSTMRNWTDPVASGVARFLYLYRLVGVTAFELLGWRWLLLVLPNTFEYFFIAYEAVRTKWDPRRITAVGVVALAAVIWVFVKLPQEWWIHIAKNDFTEFMSDHPIAWLVIGAAAAAAVAVFVRFRSRIPAPDWSFSVDVDRHLEPNVADTAPRRLFSPDLWEKVALLSMLSVIFAQILPGVESGPLGITIGVTILVVSNAAVTEFLRRRGRTWSTALSQFVSMLLINGGLVVLDAMIGGDADRPDGNTLFFVVLLSLLIALYDRYSATRSTGEGERSARSAFGQFVRRISRPSARLRSA
jgi:hypothetical protein